MIGPDGMTWFIVLVSVASFMALLLLIAIICCIVSCCRKRKKVQDGNSSSDSSIKGDETPDSAIRRLPGASGTSYNVNNTRNAADVSISLHPYAN